MIQKRIALALAAGLASTLALAGCSGYGSNDKTLNTASGQNAQAATGADGGYNGAGGYTSTDNGTAQDATAQDGAAQNNVDKAVGTVTTALSTVKKAQVGTIVVDGKGWVVYRYDKDTANPSKSNCTGACAKAWPPVLVEDSPDLTGISAGKVGTIARADGGRQVTIAGWPVYRYAKDPAPGKWTGNAVDNVWWAIKPSGKKAPYCRPGMTSSSANTSSSNTSSSGSAASNSSSSSSSGGDSSSSGGYSY